MVMNHEIIILPSIFAVFIGFIVFTILKKRKRSAKSIYKLIDDLEKKYIY
jgi:preprotein translocase subunit YajC